MAGYRDLDPKERQSNATAAKKALVEKLRATLHGPAADERAKHRQAINDQRLARAGEREAAKAKLEAEQAAEAARAAELAAQARREEEAEKIRLEHEEAERQVALLAEQKAKRDERYAARKAAKKVRRRGY
jgi:hypothetical protein